MEQRLTMIALGVKDLKKSEHFYTEILGWKKAKGSDENIVFFTLNGIQLALYPKDKLAEDALVSGAGSGFQGFTLAYNTHSEKQVDEVFAELKQKDVKITKPPQKTFWGGYSGYFADPDGYLWEVAHNPFLNLNDKGYVDDE